jgi:diacylglycerol kinase (ATP)
MSNPLYFSASTLISWKEFAIFAIISLFFVLLLSLLVNIFLEFYDSFGSYLWFDQNISKCNVYDENYVEEIWIKYRSSKFGKLILPPSCIRQIERKENRKRGNSFIDSMQKTQKLIKRVYKAALFKTSTESTKEKLHWFLDFEQFRLYEGSVSGIMTPLLCFINSKSGGQQGLYFKEQLEKLLNPYQIVDLFQFPNPLPVLQEYSKLPKMKILIAGGDGTISWILDSIDLVECWKESAEDSKPEIAILPIGTGNDLANELGWLNAMEDSVLPRFLEKVLKSQKCYLDRWKLSILPLSATSPNKADEKISHPVPTKNFQNYLGIGVDAQIVLQFHLLRNRNPQFFFHAYVNKLFYGIMGWREIWKQTCENLPKNIELYHDGKKIHLPSDTQGIVFLNISSYGGGSILWAEPKDELAPTILPANRLLEDNFDHSLDSMDDYFVKSPAPLSRMYSRDGSEADVNLDLVENMKDGAIYSSEEEGSENGIDKLQTPRLFHDKKLFQSRSMEPEMRKRVFQKVSVSDGLLEVVVVRSSFELAQVKLGITSCLKLCQGQEFELVVRQSVPIQIDGEPWIQPPCKLGIKLLHSEDSRKAIMCKPVPEEINVDVLLETLECIQKQQIITKFQSDKIVGEYIHRIQAKN